jgi:HTH-type transcriptional regulator/antitoxin HigA
MPVKVADQSQNRSYFELIRAFPLTHIKSASHLARAQMVIDQLLRQELDDGSQDYLDVLTDLVEIYEAEHIPIADASEADVLRELMRTNGLTQSQLAERVQISQSTISAVLTGARSLTRDHVVKLARYFRVSPAAFLPTLS